MFVEIGSGFLFVIHSRILQQSEPFPLPMCIEQICPHPHKHCLPAGVDLNQVCILRMVIIQTHQCNIMIPDGDMLIAFPTADSLLIEPDDPNRMGAIRNDAKEP